jgi:hypothetical protein
VCAGAKGAKRSVRGCVCAPQLVHEVSIRGVRDQSLMRASPKVRAQASTQREL